MTDSPLPPPDPAILEGNIAALRASCPTTAAALLASSAPASVRLARGRDGMLTYVWTGDDGSLRWLGRTSIPSVRAPALVEAFDAGTRNVLLQDFGQGNEVRLLLQRLAPHQAMMVVEGDAWTVALSLRLHDLTDSVSQGRLLVFVGPDAWADVRAFLLEHEGYLTPERILSWPWFDAATIADITERITSIGTAVARHRSARLEALRQSPAAPTPGKRNIAILTNVSDDRNRLFARRLAAAATVTNRSCRRFVLDDPATVHPAAIEQSLHREPPEALILLDVTPEALQCRLPPAPVFVACAHNQALSANWLRQIPPAVRLGLTTEPQRSAAIKQGIAPSRLTILPPAATAGLRPPKAASRGGIAVIADGLDASPQAAGLHLASHRKLWKAAGDIIRRQCDTYHDGRADAVLRKAEKTLHVNLKSEEIRQGLERRIRTILGPAIIRRAYCLALLEAGIAIDLYGGWPGDPLLETHDRGPWPGPETVADALTDHGLIISIEPSGVVQTGLLDGIAAGLVGFVRAHPSDNSKGGLTAVLDPEEHVRRFDSREALVARVREYIKDPARFAPIAARGMKHVNAHHTWAVRLETILQACHGD